MMNFYNPYSNPYQQQLAQMQAQQSNFIHVPSEDVARSYSVAPGASVTFIDDNAPYCYTKSAGLSQFDMPVFRKFRLVEETATDEQKSPSAAQKVPTPSDTIEPIKREIEALQARIEALENKIGKEDAE